MRRDAVFITFSLASVFVYHRSLSALVAYAWRLDSSSHILLIPFIALSLMYLARRQVFSVVGTGVVPGGAVVLVGAILIWATGRESAHMQGNEALCLSILSLVVIWAGGFLLCYGSVALRAAAFPFLFLLLMVPLPDPVLDWTIHALQQGSTQLAYLIFRTLGVPVLREGFLLSLPGVTIEVAKECSSIRSSMALFITCLIAAHLYLRTGWKAFLFVLISLPLSIVKNAIRIVTLTLLSVYVNPNFLRGDLHRDGGFVFFFLALLMLWPVFSYLEKSDRLLPLRVSGLASNLRQS